MDDIKLCQAVGNSKFNEVLSYIKDVNYGLDQTLNNPWTEGFIVGLAMFEVITDNEETKLLEIISKEERED